MNSRQNLENRNGLKEIEDSLESSVALVKSILEEIDQDKRESREEF